MYNLTDGRHDAEQVAIQPLFSFLKYPVVIIHKMIWSGLFFNKKLACPLPVQFTRDIRTRVRLGN